MRPTRALAALLAAAALTLSTAAADDRFPGIREVLQQQVGKRVALRIGSGEVIEGTVERVGADVVLVTRLAGGKDLYDATVRIDRIDAVIVKAR